MDECSVLTMRTNVIDLTRAVDEVKRLCCSNAGAYVCVSTVHMCLEAYKSPSFEKIVNDANLVIPDGKPIAIAQRLLGHKGGSQVRGQDFMDEICEQSLDSKLNIGLYGGNNIDVLQRVQENLRSKYPGIAITYAFSPPFRDLTRDEDEKVIAEIESANLDILFVGIGCPKQEIWMASHLGKCNSVMIGVGAAFDFISGNKKHAPKWMQKVVLEWFFRLLDEPQRLWRRYLILNPLFIYKFSQQLIRHRLMRK